MVKKWYGIEELVDKEINIPKDLWQYEETMREIPNHDKTEGAKKIYSRKEYIILRMKKGYIVYNRNKSFKEGHTHIKSYNVAKTIIDNCSNRKRPKTNNIYLLESHVRIATDEKYISGIKELINSKRNKTKDKYVNEKVKI